MIEVLCQVNVEEIDGVPYQSPQQRFVIVVKSHPSTDAPIYVTLEAKGHDISVVGSDLIMAIQHAMECK